MGALILDASVLIRLLDGEDAHHRAAVEAVERAGLGETRAHRSRERLQRSACRVRARRSSRGRPKWNRGNGHHRYTDERGDREAAATLRAAHSALRLPDAVVLATAQELDGELMTYDLRLVKHAGDRSATAEGSGSSGSPGSTADTSTGEARSPHA